MLSGLRKIKFSPTIYTKY